MRWGLLCKLKWTLVNQRTLFFIQTDVNHFHWKVCQNYVAEHGGKKRKFADFILNSPFSMEFDFEIDWKNQSLEYNGDQSLLHLNYWILGHSPRLCKHFGNLWSTIFLLCFHVKKALFKSNKIIRQVNVMSSWVKSLDMKRVFAAGLTG